MRSRKALDGLEQEIRDHLEQETQENIARGLSPREARRQARLKFGNGPLIMEDTRAVWRWAWLDNLRRDLVFAARMTVGIGVTVAVFTAVNALLLQPLPVRNPGQLVTLQPPEGAGAFPYPFYEFLRDADAGLSDVVAQMSTPVALTWPGGVTRATAEFVSPNIFEALGVAPVIGQTFAGHPDDSAVLVSYRLWRDELGGRHDVVGMLIRLGGRPFVVAGVAPPEFRGMRVGMAIDTWIPIDRFEDVYHQRAGYRTVVIMARLTSGVSAREAAARATVAYRRWKEEDPEQRADDPHGAITVGPGEQGLRSFLRERLRESVWLLLGACACLWLIAIVNTAGLSLSRSTARGREIGVRLALGADRTTVARHLLAESLWLTGIAGILGVLLAHQLIRIPSALVASWEGVHLSLDLTMLGGALLTSLLAAVVVTALQMVAMSRRGVVSYLTGQDGSGLRDRLAPARRIVVAQVALAVPLVVGALLFAQTLQNLLGVCPSNSNDPRDLSALAV